MFRKNVFLLCKLNKREVKKVFLKNCSFLNIRDALINLEKKS